MMSMLTYGAAGYAACIVFPCPWISSWVLKQWSKLKTSLTSVESQVVQNVVSKAATTAAPAASAAPATDSLVKTP